MAALKEILTPEQAAEFQRIMEQEPASGKRTEATKQLIQLGLVYENKLGLLRIRWRSVPRQAVP